MNTYTKITVSIVAVAVLVPVFASAQDIIRKTNDQSDTTEDEVTEIRSGNGTIEQGPIEGETGTLTPTYTGIESIDPKRGVAGTEVRLNVNDAALNGDWQLHFGKNYKPLNKDKINVYNLDRTNSDGNAFRHEVVFRIPEKLEKPYNCTPTENLDCPAVEGTLEKVESGTYPVWIENENGKTNTVEFTVTDDEEPEPNLTLKDTYKGAFEFTATLSYQNDSVWEYAVEGSVPNPCYDLETQYVQSTNQLIGWIAKPSGPGGCAAVVDEVSATGTINASKDANFKFRVGENTTAEPTQPTRGTTSQPIEGTTGPTQSETGTTEQGGTTQDNAGPTRGETNATKSTNAAISADLEQIQKLVQMLMKQVFATE